MELQIFGGCNGYARCGLAPDGSAWQHTSFINEFHWTFGTVVSLDNFGSPSDRLLIHGHSPPVDVRRIS